MKVLGIDPGTLVAGYGLIEHDGGNMKMICCGVVKSGRKLTAAERLSKLYRGLVEVVEKYRPDVVAVEHPFVSNNVGTALAIGRAQAIAMLVAANQDIPVYEYAPAKIKYAVTNYGASSKEQIQQLVKIQLGITELPQPSDAADALAVALCHISETHLSDLIEGKSKRSKK